MAAHVCCADEDGLCRIVNQESGAVVACFQPMQRVWVELGADGSRAHGPTLQMRLVSELHPLVAAQAARTTAADSALLTRDGHQVQCIMRFCSTLGMLC